MAPKKSKKQEEAEKVRTKSEGTSKPETSQEKDDASMTTRASKRKAHPPQEAVETSQKKVSKKKMQAKEESASSVSKGKTSQPEEDVVVSPKRRSKRKAQPPASSEQTEASLKKSTWTSKKTSSKQETKKQTQSVKKEEEKETKPSKKKTAKTNSGEGDTEVAPKKVAKSRGKKNTVKVESGDEEASNGMDQVKMEEDGDAVSMETGEEPNKMGVSSQGEKFVGAHMGIAGGLDKAVIGAVEIGAKSFALFLRSQRQWQAKPLEDKVAEKFRTACKEHNFSPWHILPHGSYLLNCGSPNPETLQKSRDALADELKRCKKLGLAMYNFHPGSTCGKISVDECLDKIGETINFAHKQTNSVMTVVENMSRQGNTVGGKFEELSGIIDRVEDKTRVGVCLDTCHAFAAGFDLSTESGYESMMADFEKIVGLKYIKAVHLNDSKGKVGSHLDRHENIGKGFIGMKAFRRLMNDPRFDGIPIVLETPAEDDTTYQKEIRMLYSMQGSEK